MDVTRKGRDKRDITRDNPIEANNNNNTSTNAECDRSGGHQTLSEMVMNTFSFPLSSRIFNFLFTEEDGTVDNLDQMNQLFTTYIKKSPTLEEALKSMGYEKANELAELFTKNAVEKMMELDTPGLTVEDVAAIFCYTIELNKGTTVEVEVESPYIILNKSLSVDRSNAALKKTRGFLFLLLQALRKLPRFIPENHILYRGLREFVQTEVDPKFPERKPYAAGNEKTWWAFTSTTTDLETTEKFIRKLGGSLFTVSGNPWGYDISVLSSFGDEKEILLEPERKLRVTSTYKEGNLLIINSEMLDTPLVLEKIIKVSCTIKSIKTKNKIKEIPDDLKTENITDTSVDILWGTIKGKEKNSQVSSCDEKGWTL